MTNADVREALKDLVSGSVSLDEVAEESGFSKAAIARAVRRERKIRETATYVS